MESLRVGPLPAAPLAAAAKFHADVLPLVLETLRNPGDLVLVFEPADHTHTAWRRAIVQELARANAPGRVNALAGDDEAAITAARNYLGRAPGVTGQLLPLDGTGAGAVLYQG